MDSIAPSTETGGMTLGGSKLDNESTTLEKISKTPMENSGNQLTVPLTGDGNEPRISIANTAKSSIMDEGEVLELDFLKVENKGKMGKIYYKVKKKAVESWENLSLAWKIIYVIEAPMKFLV
jgi:hypothetical protein